MVENMIKQGFVFDRKNDIFRVYFYVFASYILAGNGPCVPYHRGKSEQRLVSRFDFVRIKISLDLARILYPRIDLFPVAAALFKSH